jgi:hypothetical protein
METPTTPPTTVLTPPDLRAELEASLSDALRRATTRAEHIRLVHIQTLVSQLVTADG